MRQWGMRLISRFVIASVIMLPLFASAQSADQLQAQANALLQQVQALQAQLAAQNGAGLNTNVAVNPGVSSSGNSALCPQIGRSLKRGATGDDVSRLQQFLARDPSIYPEANISGYFGSLTEAAVQRWQVKFNIVSSGTAATTGYGVVGPRTAAAIAIVCGGGSYNGVSGASAASPVGGFIQVSPISGNAPLQVVVQATINTTNSCSAAIYTLNFGDGTNPQALPSSAGVCKPQSASFSHIYPYGGTYNVTLTAGNHQTNATVTVFGAVAPPVSSAPVPAAPAASAAPQASVGITGSAFNPKNLSVVSGTVVTWTNAENMPHTVTADNNSFGSGTLALGQSYSTTFTTPGTYPYYCKFHGNVGGVGMSGVVTVTAASTPTPAPAPAPTTTPAVPTSSYSPLGVTPGANSNPLSVQVQFDLPGCPAYSLSWGDGGIGSSATSANCTANGAGTGVTTLVHTYSQPGSYTITLTRSTRTDTAAIVISN